MFVRVCVSTSLCHLCCIHCHLILVSLNLSLVSLCVCFLFLFLQAEFLSSHPLFSGFDANCLGLQPQAVASPWAQRTLAEAATARPGERGDKEISFSALAKQPLGKRRGMDRLVLRRLFFFPGGGPKVLSVGLKGWMGLNPWMVVGWVKKVGQTGFFQVVLNPWIEGTEPCFGTPGI